jgi:hypothetical protein
VVSLADSLNHRLRALIPSGSSSRIFAHPKSGRDQLLSPALGAHGLPLTSLVPKLYLGTHLSGQLRCPDRGEESSFSNSSVILSGGERKALFYQEHRAEPKSKDLRGPGDRRGKYGSGSSRKAGGSASHGEGSFRCGRSPVKGARSFDALGSDLPGKGSFSPRSLRMTTRFVFAAVVCDCDWLPSPARGAHGLPGKGRLLLFREPGFS